MVKVIATSILLVSLFGMASMQNMQDPMGMQQGMQQGMQGMQQGMQSGNNLLSSLFGGSSNGLGETIRQLPARGMQMLNDVLSGVRNILPNLGRNNMNPQMPQMNMPQMNMPQMNMPQGGPLDGLLNGLQGTLNGLPNTLNNLPNTLNSLPNALNGGMQNPMNNMQQNMGNPQNPLGNLLNGVNTNAANLPRLNLEHITRPVTDALNQGRLPNTNDITQGLTRTLSDTVSSLSNQASQANQQRAV